MVAEPLLEQAPPQEEASDEELEDLPEAEKQADPLRHARISRMVDGTQHEGEVEDIECGKITRERLYRIKYTDGDLEHLTAAQVREMQIKAARHAQAQPEADAPLAEAEVGGKAAVEEGQAAEEGEEIKKPGRGRGQAAGVEKEIMKKPAAAKGKAKAKAKAVLEEALGALRHYGRLAAVFSIAERKGGRRPGRGGAPEACVWVTTRSRPRAVAARPAACGVGCGPGWAGWQRPASSMSACSLA
eukprot:CAMPEP_0168440988 /NCGR_PEP_ID=MMETSP0228-20121227/43255_1 /TAXON_ID=133427 /ORGANISM="Protoceratium reticulatum, Strain CCCM 535 (=CCMP 1889)" /LENGTH=243 /DNA_ID=CAMNT_0008455293 /DNA_START=52 /DNA_END=779 /DNA_ORIENTATION=+